MDTGLNHFLYFGIVDTNQSIRFRDHLIIEGQGTVGVRVEPGTRLSIALYISSNIPASLRLDLTESGGKLFSVCPEGREQELEANSPKGIDATKLVPGVEDSYWLSLDKKNGQLRYGKSYKCVSSTCLVAKLDIGDEKTKPGPHIWAKKLRKFSVVSPVAFETFKLSLPVVVDPPPHVAGSAIVTLEDLSDNVASIANLSPECQRLYANISGPRVVLDDSSFPEFSQAIEYSIRTPGKLCHERLTAKAGQFGDRRTTYLRLTLGLDKGDSPGVPYVVEIWPAKHKSPVHDHGNAFAIIKILHGKIKASYFDRLDNHASVKREPDYMFQQGDVTWIGPDHYQIHQLHNVFDRVCVTIQCYQYAEHDHDHDEYFDFLDHKTGERRSFYPNSDWCFDTFKKLIKEEWYAHLNELPKVKKTVVLKDVVREARKHFSRASFAALPPKGGFYV